MPSRSPSVPDHVREWRIWRAIPGGALVIALTLLAPAAAGAQGDLDLEECGFICQSGVFAEDPADLDIIGIDDIDADYVAPPAAPAPVDSDGDGLTDGDETAIYGTDPYNPDTNGNGVPDGYEGLDSDGDGVGDWHEIYVYGTDPLVADQPVRGVEGSVGGDTPPPDEIGEDDCTYATPDTCFPRVEPPDESVQ